MGIFSRLFHGQEEQGADAEGQAAGSEAAAKPEAEAAPANKKKAPPAAKQAAAAPSAPTPSAPTPSATRPSASPPVTASALREKASPSPDSESLPGRAKPATGSPVVAVPIAGAAATQPATATNAAAFWTTSAASMPPAGVGGAKVGPSNGPSNGPTSAKSASVAAAISASASRTIAAPKPAEPTPTSPPRSAVPSELLQEAARAGDGQRIFQSITGAFEALREPRSTAPNGDAKPAAEGTSDAQDLAAVRATFHEIAGVHVAHVRDVMLELRFGDVPCSLIESTVPALGSLRSMAATMQLNDLCGAIDEFCDAVKVAVTGAAKVKQDRKDQLLRQYQQLIQLLPTAFDLDGERDRREPIIVESLLMQVAGVERVVLDKLFAVGLSRLDTLLRATAEEMVVVAGIRQEVADRIVERFRQHYDANHAAVSAPDARSAHQELEALAGSLRAQHEEFERASSGWSADDRARKLDLRREREQTFLRVKVLLARLGERDRIDRLERLAFRERIEQVEGFLAQSVRALSSAPKPAAKT
jgi:hypothetical protein